VRASEVPKTQEGTIGGRPLGSPEETDHVFRNDNLVGSSMLVVAVTADILSALILWNGLKSYVRSQESLKKWVAALPG
jgi:hypothetical protein